MLVITDDDYLTSVGGPRLALFEDSFLYTFAKV